jgi:hypothetical protein
MHAIRSLSDDFCGHCALEIHLDGDVVGIEVVAGADDGFGLVPLATALAALLIVVAGAEWCFRGP